MKISPLFGFAEKGAYLFFMSAVGGVGGYQAAKQRMLVKEFAQKAGNAEMLEAVRQSQFLQERYMSRAVRGFEKGMMHKVEDMAAYGLELGDKIVNEVGWFAAYRQGKEMADVTDPVRYADDMVRSCVGGRGIGEMPAVVKSRLVNSLIPFQVEILNTYNIYKRVLQENGKFKSFGKLAELMIGNSIFNAVMTMTIGRSILFDPIAVIAKCLMDDGDDDDTEVDGYLDKTVDCMLRLTGNFLSTAPFAAFVMGVFCDQEDIKQLFGEENPNRYGTGLLGVGKIFHEGVNLTLGNDVDWKGAATAFVKYGKQIDRILEFMEDYSYLPDIEFSRKSGLRLNGPSLDGKFRFGADQTGRFGRTAVCSMLWRKSLPICSRICFSAAQPQKAAGAGLKADLKAV